MLYLKLMAKRKMMNDTLRCFFVSVLPFITLVLLVITNYYLPFFLKKTLGETELKATKSKNTKNGKRETKKQPIILFISLLFATSLRYALFIFSPPFTIVDTKLIIILIKEIFYVRNYRLYGK